MRLTSATVFRLLARLAGSAVLLAMLAALLPAPVHAAPGIFLAPGSGAPGTRVRLSGFNFTSYVGDQITVFFDETQVGAIPSVPAPGDFRMEFTVPSAALPGTRKVSARSRAGTALSEVEFAVPTPQVRLDTYGGSVGTRVLASARGFHSGRPVTFSYRFNGDEEIAGVQIAGSTGECSIGFNIPASPLGQHPVNATNEEGHFAQVNFEVVPSVTIEPGSAAVGDKIILSGTGFPAGREISVALLDQKVAFATTSVRGSFIAQFLVPILRAGTYLAKVEDFGQEVRWVELIIVPRISLSKAAGEVGARLTLTGTGYEVRSIVVIRFDSADLAVVTTDGAGAFAASLVVPQGAAGTHIVTATDGTNTKQLGFAVESEPPVQPQPLAPKNRVEVSAPVTFDWEGVYDVSQPVLYTFQVARTDDFFEGRLIDKSGITVAHYTLSGAEALLPNRRGTYYFWRVRATDGASNVGDWSEPAAFRIKPVDILPPWARYVLVLVMALIVLLYLILLRGALKKKVGPPETEFSGPQATS